MSDVRYWMDEDGEVLVTGTDGRGLPERWREVLPVVVGSRDWAALMTLDGVDVGRHGDTLPWSLTDIKLADAMTDGWYLFPTGPKRGDRVRGWDCHGSEWVGPYYVGGADGGHWLGVKSRMVYVERVEVIP